MIREKFDSKPFLNVCAPMVRYSKLQFRTLVREYEADLCFTPMIMADSFIKSYKARNNEFTTDKDDTPLIVQFAANKPDDFTTASMLVSPYCDGVDLNCGCPQRWAMKLGIGAQLLHEPQTIKEIVSSVRNRVSKDFSVSVKMRIVNNKNYIIDLCRQLEHAGVTFLTVHGRTKDQTTEVINVEIIKDIIQSVDVPVIANGDVKTLDQAVNLHHLTDCKGVMCARGILQNPAMFTGCSQTPLTCVQRWVELCLQNSVHFITFHHHLVFMLSKLINKYQKRIFNNFNTYTQVLDFLNEFFNFNFDTNNYKCKKNLDECSIWEKENNVGSYFMKQTCNIDVEDYLHDSLNLYL